ncbi:hypothetical protein CCICO_05550 [Corynebacterium ciconiae DSM 44920]|uniref:VWA domain-containing protein n=1 Tax=Corynebacterium ciconiae TaxID=227319 RepID=UPI0003690D4E|nr:VWA domain-containing protein [Corynebacterium ciconiae]WKD61138.1 hypothetical protein CCICO_05550 [Corynebacterium ciconiae DSM 44920]
MARHASGESNYRLSKELITSAVLVIVLVVAFIVWLTVRSSADSADDSFAQDCIEGELHVPVAVSASTPDPVATSLIDAYSDTSPIVKDHCVSLETVSDPAAAAVVISTGTRGEVQRQLDAAHASAASEKWAIGESTPVGLAYRSDSPAPDTGWEAQTAERVFYPEPATNPAASLVAAAISGDNPDTGEKLLKDNTLPSYDLAAESQLLAVTEDETPEGMDFFAPDDTQVPTFVVPLTTHEGISEEQSRAGADFAKFVTAQNEDAEDKSVLWASTADILSERYAQVPEESTGSTNQAINNTLLLLDTSDAMNASPSGHSLYAETARIADPLVVSAIRAGGSVALWNYSSPLSEGVTKGWRDNISFSTDSTAIVDTMKRFGTGGVPQTREALAAALPVAAEQARSTGEPTQIVLVTSGTNDSMSDEQLREILDRYRDAKVQLDVLTVGGGAEDSVITDFARSTGGHVGTATDAPDIANRLQQSFGIDRP